MKIFAFQRNDEGQCVMEKWFFIFYACEVENCPVAWQGQNQGKEVFPTIVMEALCDHNLWFWHATFNFPGSMNDIHILSQNSLQISFIDGTFIVLDFDFEIGAKNFGSCFLSMEFIRNSHGL